MMTPEGIRKSIEKFPEIAKIWDSLKETLQENASMDEKEAEEVTAQLFMGSPEFKAIINATNPVLEATITSSKREPFKIIFQSLENLYSFEAFLKELTDAAFKKGKLEGVKS